MSPEILTSINILRKMFFSEHLSESHGIDLWFAAWLRRSHSLELVFYLWLLFAMLTLMVYEFILMWSVTWYQNNVSSDMSIYWLWDFVWQLATTEVAYGRWSDMLSHLYLWQLLEGLCISISALSVLTTERLVVYAWHLIKQFCRFALIAYHNTTNIKNILKFVFK